MRRSQGGKLRPATIIRFYAPAVRRRLASWSVRCPSVENRLLEGAGVYASRRSSRRCSRSTRVSPMSGSSGLSRTDAHFAPAPARPRNTRTARLTRTMSSSERRPIRLSSFTLETVVTLSIINRLTSRNPFCFEGSIGSRSSGASTT